MLAIFTNAAGIRPDYLPVGGEDTAFLSRAAAPTGQYETVLYDGELKAPVHPHCRKSAHLSGERWMRTAISDYVQDGATFRGKFPVNFILKLQDKVYLKWINVVSLHIENEYVYVELRKEPYTGSTKVSWGDATKELDILNDIVTYTYDDEVYNLIDSVDLSKSYRRVTIDGKGSTTDVQLSIRGHNPDTDLCLFVRNTGKRPKIESFDDVNGKNVGGDFFIFPDKETRDKFLSVFTVQLVLDFIAQVSYNKYDSMRLAHKEYIFNPITLDLL